MKTETQRKKVSGLIIGAIVAGAIWLTVAGCPLGVPGDWYSEIRGSVIADYNLQAYVPVPAAGAVPVKAVDWRRDLEVSVTWLDGEGNDVTGALETFALGAAYQAQITLKAKAGYVFDGGTSFAYIPQDVVERQPDEDLSGGERALSPVQYKAVTDPLVVPEGDLDLTAHIPAPETGNFPERNFFAGSYGGAAVWKAGEKELTGFFEPVTAYEAEVRLYPGAGYVFPAGVPVIHRGADPAPGPFTAASDGSASGLIAFPETVRALVKDLDLTGKVPAPVKRGKAVTSFSTPEYTGTVTWDPEPAGGRFAGWTVYVAEVTLTPTEAYSLEGATEQGFTHGGALLVKTAANEDGTVTVMITFPETTDEEAVPVDDLDLGGKVFAPAAGGVPVWYFSASQYTGSVEWKVTGGAALEGLFAGGTKYTATVTMTAVSGRTFDGVGENAFHHGGASSVTNAAGEGMVTLTFPAAPQEGGSGSVEGEIKW
jgi:hypothetical protein